MTGGFVVGALEKNYAFLDECPPNLLAAVITLPVGTLPERVAGARCWYDALLDGRLPPPGTWPQAPLDVPARQALDSMGLVRFCKEQPEIVKSLMTDVLSSFSRQSATFREEVATQLQKLEELERIRLAEEALDLDVQKNLVTSRKHQLKDIFLDEATLERLRQEAEAEVARRARDTDAEMTKAWGERSRAWAEIADVFGDLGQMLGRGWDMSIGLLKHTGWFDLLRLKALVEKLPQLREIVRALGRLHATNDGASVAETILVPVRRLEEELQEIRTPHTNHA